MLQSTGSKRVRHNLAPEQQHQVHMHKRTYFRSEQLRELTLRICTNYPAPDLTKTKTGPLCPAAPKCNVIMLREFSSLLILF